MNCYCILKRAIIELNFRYARIQKLKIKNVSQIFHKEK